MKRARRAKDVEALMRELKRYRAALDAARTVDRNRGRSGPGEKKKEEEEG